MTGSIPTLRDRVRAMAMQWDVAFPLAPADRAKCWVYIVASGDLLKIGRSVAPWQRIRDLQMSSPVALEPLLIMRASASVERELHERFAAVRAHGEWFHASEGLRAFVAAETARLGEAFAASANRPSPPLGVLAAHRSRKRAARIRAGDRSMRTALELAAFVLTGEVRHG